MVGWPRRVSLRPVPSRAALFAKSRKEALAIEPWLTKNDFRHFRWMREAATEIQPFHSRSFYSGNAALSFQHMNGDQPLTTSPYHDDGQLERLELIRSKLPGVDDVVTRVPPEGAGQVHMFEAAAMMWTARRASGRAISRLPLDPEWDEAGIRVELVRYILVLRSVRAEARTCRAAVLRDVWCCARSELKLGPPSCGAP